MPRTKGAIGIGVLVLVVVGVFAYVQVGDHTVAPCVQLQRIADDVNSGRIDNLESVRRVAGLNTKDSRDGVRIAAVNARSEAIAYLALNEPRPDNASLPLVDALLSLRSSCAGGYTVPFQAQTDSSAPTSSQAAAPVVPPVGDTCLVGTWRALQITSHATFAGATDVVIGGAGTIKRIEPDGAVTVDYSDSAAWHGTVGGTPLTSLKRGIETHHASATNGLYSVSGGNESGVTITLTVNGRRYVTASTWSDGSSAYSCDETTLTIANEPGNPADVFTRG